MRLLPTCCRPLAALALGLLATCQPADPPARTAGPPARPAPATPPLDTLHLPGGQVAELRPATAAAFARLDSASSVPALGHDSSDQPLPAGVRRVGRRLLLQPTAGPLVRVVSSRPAATTEGNSGCNYQYWGSLPAAHQWVAFGRGWAYEQTLLIDQRTGRQLVVDGRPAASPKGSYVLVCGASWEGGDGFNGLTLVGTTPAGPRQLWRRPLRGPGPQQARWAAPGCWLLQVASRAELAGDLPYHYQYLALTLPPTSGQR